MQGISYIVQNGERKLLAIILLVSQVAAKASVDLTTDNEGRLSEQQRQGYKACMKHEYAVYKELVAGNHCAHGIPAVYGTGESLG